MRPHAQLPTETHLQHPALHARTAAAATCTTHHMPRHHWESRACYSETFPAQPLHLLAEHLNVYWYYKQRQPHRQPCERQGPSTAWAQTRTPRHGQPSPYRPHAHCTTKRHSNPHNKRSCCSSCKGKQVSARIPHPSSRCASAATPTNRHLPRRARHALTAAAPAAAGAAATPAR
jgi:hypothetical protein